jgi:hypothetical protein
VFLGRHTSGWRHNRIKGILSIGKKVFWARPKTTIRVQNSCRWHFFGECRLPDDEVKGLNDQMIVTARMHEEAERRWVITSDDTWSALESLSRSQKGTLEAVHPAATIEKLSVKVDALAGRQTNTQAALDPLIADIDPFDEARAGTPSLSPKG